jgi:hypothetical protein
MNHKWHNNTCAHCGLKRKMKSRKMYYTYPLLDPQGNFYNATTCQTAQRYYYGKEHGFNRPDCPEDILQEKAA